MWTYRKSLGTFYTAMSELCCLVLLFGTLVQGAPSITSEVSGLSKEKVVLPCQLSQESCGAIHSIKWYRGERRVYIFSEIGPTSRAEDDLVGRAELRLETNNSLAQLEIDPLMTADEDLYKCEVTYLEAKDHCALLQSIRLSTFAKPEYVRIENLMSGTEPANASLIGPFNEGTVITLVCISGGGKPVARLDWFNSSNPLYGQYTNMTADDGTGIGSSQVQIELTRGDLGAKLECRASSPTLTTPMIAWVEVDVYVRPATWEVTGYEAPVLEGTIVTLLCRVKGARPAANITWYNGTRILSPQPHSNLAVQPSDPDYIIESEVIEADGTYETQSRLSFTAKRFDNGILLDCQTSNLVMESMGELPYRSPTKIQVHYKPLVTVLPLFTTVNETSDVLLACEVNANPPELITVRWFQNGQLLELSDIAHYEGGTALEPALLIKNVTREDLGNYTCTAHNAIGETMSHTRASVNVLYKAAVKVTMDPPLPVREQDQRNVTLTCEVVTGNPEVLEAVRWYLNGDLLKELPDCPNATSNEEDSQPYYSELCDIDPSKLMLQAVGRSFQGNYQCKARNAAGWGEISPLAKLHVYYPPGPARLEFEPLTVVKNLPLNLRCIVDEPGRPPAKVFRWMRGTHVQMDQSSSNWTINAASLEHRANFSCEAINEAGHGPAATVPIDVFVGPTFINPLSPYHGVPWNSTDVKITCQVECYPECAIYWLKNGLPINSESPLYSIKNTNLPADPNKNDFESVVSTLSANMANWPGGKLDRAVDNANYTCQSNGNDFGNGVSSSTHFRVEYPPEKIKVSKRVVNVIENEHPSEVTCSAVALPEATYSWKYGNQDVSNKAVLFLNYTLKRDHGGDYECIAENPHGQISTKTTINVQYIPECTITTEELNDDRILVCTAKANPGQVDFQWWLGNATYDDRENVVKKGLRSELKLINSPEYFGNYRCFANNSVGTSNSCEFIISGSWIRKLSDHTLLIFAAIAVAVIILFVIVCIIIILICRRRRMSEKHHNTRPEERQNPEGKDLTGSVDGGAVGSSSQDPPPSPAPDPNASNNNATTQSDSNKWPIKPGVHLHVNGLHSLGKSVNKPVNGFSYGTKHSSCSTLPYTTVAHSISEIPVSTSRKRKKPARRDPSPAHRKGDLSDDGKAFYENLPFHGLQSAQSKLEETIVPMPEKSSEVRPPSELSQTGSSGYGSTRSQKDPGVEGIPCPKTTSNDASSHSIAAAASGVPAKSLSEDEADLVPDMGPKTSTPIQSVNFNKTQLPFGRRHPPTTPVASTRNGIPQVTPTSPQNNVNIKLATVRPQRISFSSSSNFGSLRPFRMPEAPKVFFRSVRGKNPHPPINHFLTRNSIRIERDRTNESPATPITNKISPNPFIVESLGASETVPTSTKSLPKTLNKKKGAQKQSSSKLKKTKHGSLSSNDDNNNHEGRGEDGSWEPVPRPAPRAQTLGKSRKHTYQNIPFTRKTPRAETLLSPLSLQFHQNANSHHPLLAHHQQTNHSAHHHQSQHPQQPPYATTHRTFPSAQAADLIFSSLQRKGGSTGGRSSTTPNDLDGRGRLWYADLVQGQANGHHNSHMNGGGSSGKTNGRSNHHQNSNGHGQHQAPAGNNGYVPNNRNGLHFPLIRGSEINV